MDKILISGEQLDFSGNYNISLEANDFLNFKPGTAYKSERLTIYNTPKNRRLLGNIFHINADTVATFDCNFVTDIIQMAGVLQILQCDQQKAEAVFISGNGKLWDELKGIKLNEIDCSEYDHTLNKATVLASETVTDTSFYVYDFTDRGTLTDTTGVNITERYPAINLRNLLTKIFSGYTLSGDLINETWFKKIFLLFTQTNQIRNSEDWKTSALIGVGKTGSQTNALTISAPDFSLTQTQVTFVETSPFFDNGGNFASNIYTAPETGTYRFKFTRAATLALGSTAGNVSGTVTFSIKKNTTTTLISEVYTLLNQVTNSIASATIDSQLIELAAGDTVQCFVEVAGTFDGSIPLGANLVLTNACTLINSVSRWYGNGSTVQMSKILPDTNTLEFLADVFSYFGLYPFYNVEERILNLYQLKSTNTVNDISERVDLDSGVSFEIPEPVNYYLKFATDSADKQMQFAIDNKLMEDGNYEYNIEKKETVDIKLRLLCNTFMDFSSLSQNVKIPKLWADLTGLKHSTKFGLRLLYYSGNKAITYNLNHGLDTGVISTERSTAPVFTNLDTDDGVNLNFSEQSSIDGMYQFYWRALQMVTQGKFASCDVLLSASEISQFYALFGNDFRVPVYITSPYVSGRFMVLKLRQKAGNVFELSLLQKFD